MTTGSAASAEAPPPIALLTSRYPSLSETFVWREARAIEARGWPVVGVSMHVPDAATRELAELPRPDVLLRRPGLRSLLVDAICEVVRHPLRSTRTLATALADAISPGEPTSLGGRARNLLHAISGLAAARQLRPRGIAHIHCHFAHAPAGVGLYAARQLGISWSFVGHANDLFANRLLLRRKLARAGFVSCISEWHRDWYREQAPAVSTPLPVIRCGVPHEPVDGDADEAAVAGRLRLVSVARLVPKKGLDTLVRAVDRLASESDLDVSLLIAGDGPERATLERLAAACRDRARVDLLGSVAPSRVHDLIAEADVFALPCRIDAEGDRDGIPVALMEAMTTGVPVVAGDLPTLRELVIPDQTGILCPADDPEALAAVLARLARDPARRRALGEAGRQHAIREFSMAVNAERLDQALRRTIGLEAH